MVNVSLDTEMSIVEEFQKPIVPSEPPYQRRKLKKYVEGSNGVLQGILEIEPYELDPDTVKMISKTVWKKLRMDAELTRQMENEVKAETKLMHEKYGKGMLMRDDHEKKESASSEYRLIAEKQKNEASKREEMTAGKDTKRTRKNLLS